MASRAAHGALTPSRLERILEPGPVSGSGRVALWEEVHQGAFLYGFLLLAMGSLLVVCPVSGGRPGRPPSGWPPSAAFVDLARPVPVRGLSRASRAGPRCASAPSSSRRAALLAMVGPAWATFGREGRGAPMVDPRIGRFAGPVAAFAAMVAWSWATAAVLFARKIGFDRGHVQAFYLGSEATFAPPRSLAGLLEVAVPHLLAIPMLVFVTLHLVAFAVGVRRRPFAARGRDHLGLRRPS